LPHPGSAGDRAGDRTTDQSSSAATSNHKCTLETLGQDVNVRRRSLGGRSAPRQRGRCQGQRMGADVLRVHQSESIRSSISPQFIYFSHQNLPFAFSNETIRRGIGRASQQGKKLLCKLDLTLDFRKRAHPSGANWVCCAVCRLRFWLGVARQGRTKTWSQKYERLAHGCRMYACPTSP